MSERDAYNQKKAELLARSPVLLVFLSHHDVPDVTLASRFESLEIGFQQRQHLRRNSDAAENSVSSAVSEVSNILVLGGLVDNDLREN
ncbi:MAG TPA: hypothetical protein VFQ63_04180, partial [Patescibacteria group bacterium]|nr:hypothetical protein [Patescibacteria group bacterium]